MLENQQTKEVQPVKFFEESEFLELKKSTSELKEAIISIVAILNKHGAGELYFGIKKNISAK